MKGIPTYSLLVKVARGVFQRCVESETTLDFNSLPFEELSSFTKGYRINETVQTIRVAVSHSIVEDKAVKL